MRTHVLACLTALALAAPAAAAPVIYSFSGLLSGTLGGDPFDSARAVFTLATDTDTVVNGRRPTIFVTEFTELAFTIDGVDGVFSSQFQAFSNVGRGRFSIVGLTEEDGSDIFDIADIAFQDYDLRTEIGPIRQSPPDFLNQNTPYATSAGELVLFEDPNNALSFRARLGTAVVPEPATWAMMIAGFGLVGLAARQRRAPA